MGKITGFDTIEDLVKLEEFKNAIDGAKSPPMSDEVEARYKAALKPSSIWKKIDLWNTASKYSAELKCNYLNEGYKDAMPTTVTVTPEIAYYLAEDASKFQERSDALTKRTDPTVSYMTFFGNAFLTVLFPNPHTASVAGGAFVKSILKSKEYEKEIKRINSERNIIVKDVLDIYQLREDQNGNYQLKLGEWQPDSKLSGGGQSSTVDFFPAFRSNGLQTRFNMNKLKEIIQEKLKIAKNKGGREE